MRSLRARSSVDDTEQLFGFLVKDETMWEELSTPLTQQERVVMNYCLNKMKKVLLTGAKARQLSHGVVARFIPDFLTTMANAIIKNPPTVAAATITSPFTETSVKVAKDFLTQNFKEPDIEFLSVVKETGVMFHSSMDESDENEDSVSVKLIGSWEAISKAYIHLQNRAQIIAFSKIDDAISSVLDDRDKKTKKHPEGNQKVSCLEMLRGTRINKPHPLLYKVLKRKKKRLLMKKKRKKIGMLKKIDVNGRMSPAEKTDQSASREDTHGIVGSVENKLSVSSASRSSVYPVNDSNNSSVGENAIDVNAMSSESNMPNVLPAADSSPITPHVITTSMPELTASHKPGNPPDANRDAISTASVLSCPRIVSVPSSTDRRSSVNNLDTSPPVSPEATAGLMSFNIGSSNHTAALSGSKLERNVVNDNDLVTRPPRAASPDPSPSLMSFNITRNNTNVFSVMPGVSQTHPVSAPYTVPPYLAGIEAPGALDVQNVSNLTSNNFSGPGTMMEMFAANVHSVAPPISYNPFQRKVTPDLPTMFIPTVVCDDPSKNMGPPDPPPYSNRTTMYHAAGLHAGVANAGIVPMNVYDNTHPGMSIQNVPAHSPSMVPHESGYSIIHHPHHSQLVSPHYGVSSLVNTAQYANTGPRSPSPNMMNAARASTSPHIALPTVFARQEKNPSESTVQGSPARTMPTLQPAFSPDRRQGTLVSRQMPELQPIGITADTFALQKKDSSSIQSDTAHADLVIKMPSVETGTMRKPPSLQLCSSANKPSPAKGNGQLIMNLPIAQPVGRLELSTQLPSSSQSQGDEPIVADTTDKFMIITNSEAVLPKYSVQVSSTSDSSEMPTIGYTVRKSAKSTGYTKHVIVHDKISKPIQSLSVVALTKKPTPTSGSIQLSENKVESDDASVITDQIADEDDDIVPVSEDDFNDKHETSPPRDIRCGGRNELPMKKEVITILDNLLKIKKTTKGRFRCPLFAQCKYLAAHKKILREHYIRSHIGCAWECIVCLEPFSQRYKLREHMVKVHPDVNFKRNSP